MSIETAIEETKRKSALINGLAIDWQYIQQLAPQVLNNDVQATPELKNACNSLIRICERSENSLRELKSLIPVFSQE